ncbi:tRNA (adenosine(37)-N6)-threonylcarbamoyltransferase complex dimerization subunit type 1 TsaB [bacterium]|nr:tRNA (adenosine(37)-N6)-threonylcarbamoyltransferase complex dimerization subunit type 1 TsaB [bacterium]
MKILSIETSTKQASVAFFCDDVLLDEQINSSGRDLATYLLPAIEEMLDKLGLDVCQIDALVCAQGPGFFTSLRIGITTARMMAQVLGIPVVGIPTLDGLAFGLSSSKALICPILDARKSEVYVALYRMRGPGRELERLTDYLVLSPLKLARMIKEEVVFLGDGISLHKDILKENLGDLASFSLNLPRASSLIQLAHKRLTTGDFSNYSSLLPLYLRPSYAEENKE